MEDRAQMEFSPEQVEAHETLTKAGWKIVNEEALIAGHAPKPVPGFFARRRLKKGIRLFTDALKINPKGWPSMWAIGKLHQRFGDDSAALRWFVAAHQIKPDQSDVLREAGLAALNVGAKEDALKLCFAAVRVAPDDLGLQSNLALAYLLAGDDEHAEECARMAASCAPEDAISQAVLTLVRDVRQGRRKRPERLTELS